MKKTIGLVLALCLLFLAVVTVYGESDPLITQQPETSTTTKDGTVVFQIAVRGQASAYSWFFVNPKTGKRVSGKKLSKSVKGVKVTGPNRAKITLSNVPESMHGWLVYCQVNINQRKIQSDSVMLLVYGMDPPEAAPSEDLQITKQPKSSKIPESGKITFTVTYSGLAEKITWAFINPKNGKKVIGKKILNQFKSLKASGYNKNKLVLSNVPETMVGWGVYAHLKYKKTEIDTDIVYVLGPDDPDPVEEKKEKPKTEETVQADQTSSDTQADSEEFQDKTITVLCTSRALRKLGADGKAEEGDPVSSLEFINTGSFIVSSADPIKSWTVNGMRVEPASPVHEFKVINITDDVSLTLNTVRAAAGSAEPDESRMCRVTCVGCTFSYIRGGLRSVAEGEVPANAPISVVADSSDKVSAGYRINGGDPVNAGLTTFRFIVTEDVQISLN